MAQTKPEIKLRGRSGGIYCGKPGNDYQLYVTMYILLRAFNTYAKNFELRMDCPPETDGGEFDDIYLKVDNDEQLLVQVKHCTSRSCLTRGMLLPRTAKEKGPFSLYKFSSSVRACRKKKAKNQKCSYLLLTNLPLSDRTLDLFEEGDSKSVMMNVMKVGRFFKLRNTSEMQRELGVSKDFFLEFTLSAESLGTKDIKSRIKDEIIRCTQEDPRIATAELEQELTDWVCNKETRNGCIDRKWVEHFFRKLQVQNERASTLIPQVEDNIENGQFPTVQIFTLRQILEKCRKFQFDTHHLFVDFKQTKYCILVDVAKRAGLNTSSTIFTQDSQAICFPDRVDIIGRTLQIVAKQYRSLKAEAEKVGLMVNTSNTKYLQAGGTTPESTHVRLHGDTFEAVKEFIYHESIISSDNSCSKEIARCITVGNQIFQNLKNSLKSSKLLYQEQILSQVLRGCETWTMLKKDLQALAVFERQVLRVVFPSTRRTNEKLAQLYGEPTIEQVAKARRVRWAGQMARLPDSDPLKIILFSDPSCSKRHGQSSSWLQQVERDLQGVANCRGSGDGGNWRYAARDETRWRAVVDEIRLKC